MTLVWVALAGAAGIGLGVWAGYRRGKRLEGGPTRPYWVANVLVFVIGVALNAVGALLTQAWVFAASLGLMAGGFTGLKYGFGKSVGIWATADRLAGSDSGKGNGP
jgi:hypothetical protein